MQKFPVTSKNGNEYLVVVEMGYIRYVGEILDVTLYRSEVKIGLFGRKKEVLIRLYSTHFDENEKEFNSYVEASKKCVELYEMSIEKKERKKREKEERKKRMHTEFERWNGEC